MDVKFYMPRLSDDDMDWIRSIALRRYQLAPRYSDWLKRILGEESARRITEMKYSATPTEPTFPWIDLHKWSAEEIGTGLLCVNTLADSATSAAVRDFGCAVRRSFVAAACTWLTTVGASTQKQLTLLHHSAAEFVKD